MRATKAQYTELKQQITLHI